MFLFVFACHSVFTYFSFSRPLTVNKNVQTNKQIGSTCSAAGVRLSAVTGKSIEHSVALTGRREQLSISKASCVTCSTAKPSLQLRPCWDGRRTTTVAFWRWHCSSSDVAQSISASYTAHCTVVRRRPLVLVAGTTSWAYLVLVASGTTFKSSVPLLFITALLRRQQVQWRTRIFLWRRITITMER